MEKKNEKKKTKTYVPQHQLGGANHPPNIHNPPIKYDLYNQNPRIPKHLSNAQYRNLPSFMAPTFKLSENRLDQAEKVSKKAPEVTDHREVLFKTEVHFLDCEMIQITLFSYDNCDWVVEKELQYHIIFLDKIIDGFNRRSFQNEATRVSAKIVVRKKTGTPPDFSGADVSRFFEKNTPSLTLWKYDWLQRYVTRQRLDEYLSSLPLYCQIRELSSVVKLFSAHLNYKDKQLKCAFKQITELENSPVVVKPDEGDQQVMDEIRQTEEDRTKGLVYCMLTKDNKAIRKESGNYFGDIHGFTTPYGIQSNQINPQPTVNHSTNTYIKQNPIESNNSDSDEEYDQPNLPFLNQFNPDFFPQQFQQVQHVHDNHPLPYLKKNLPTLVDPSDTPFPQQMKKPQKFHMYNESHYQQSHPPPNFNSTLDNVHRFPLSNDQSQIHFEPQQRIQLPSLQPREFDIYPNRGPPNFHYPT